MSLSNKLQCLLKPSLAWLLCLEGEIVHIKFSDQCELPYFLDAVWTAGSEVFLQLTLCDDTGNRSHAAGQYNLRGVMRLTPDRALKTILEETK